MPNIWGVETYFWYVYKAQHFQSFPVLVQTFGWWKHIKKSQTSILEKYFFSEHIESF